MVQDWDAFGVRFPEAHTTLAPLFNLQREEAPKVIDSGLRGLVKGSLVDILGEDDGRFLLESVWGISSTLKLSQLQGNVITSFLRGVRKEQLGTVVDALKTYDGIVRSAHIAAEAHAQNVSAIEQAALELGAEITPVACDERIQEMSLEQTAAELYAVTTAMKEERLIELPEAPSSVNFFFSIAGYNMQWTLRDVDDGMLLRRLMKHLAVLEKAGAYPVDRYGNQIAVVDNVAPQTTTTTTASATQPRPQPQQPQPTVTDDGYEKFLVTEISAQVTPNGNEYYAVKGGMYKKFGVSAWPEIGAQLLELCDVDLDGLDIGQSWSAAGQNLFALAEKPEGEKYAKKIVGFVKE